jgi:uncharacterized DUF497 family protein
MEIELSELEWDEFNVEHIAKHGVSIVEIQEVCQSQIDVLSGYDGRQMLFGKTNRGRYLTVILARKSNNNYYVVTARDTSKKERRYVNEQEKNK